MAIVTELSRISGDYNRTPVVSSTPPEPAGGEETDDVTWLIVNGLQFMRFLHLLSACVTYLVNWRTLAQLFRNFRNLLEKLSGSSWPPFHRGFAFLWMFCVGIFMTWFQPKLYTIRDLHSAYVNILIAQLLITLAMLHTIFSCMKQLVHQVENKEESLEALTDGLRKKHLQSFWLMTRLNGVISVSMVIFTVAQLGGMYINLYYFVQERWSGTLAFYWYQLAQVAMLCVMSEKCSDQLELLKLQVTHLKIQLNPFGLIKFDYNFLKMAIIQSVNCILIFGQFGLKLSFERDKGKPMAEA